MKLLEPQVTLIRQSNLDTPDDFFLHAVTFCPQTNFRANGHAPIPRELDETGVWNIGVHILKDETAPDFHCLTPVTHTIELGSFPGAKEGVIQINLFIDRTLHPRGLETKEKKVVAKTIVSTTDADEDGRPIEDF